MNYIIKKIKGELKIENDIILKYSFKWYLLWNEISLMYLKLCVILYKISSMFQIIPFHGLFQIHTFELTEEDEKWYFNTNMKIKIDNNLNN